MQIIKKDSIKEVLRKLNIDYTVLEKVKSGGSLLIGLEKFNKKYKIQVRKGYNGCYYYQLLKL